MLFATLLLSILLGATISVASSKDEELQASIQAQVEAMDVNGDGCFTIKEYLTAFSTALARELSDKETSQMEGQMRPFFEKGDQDGDDCLTVEEVMAARAK